jgi:hypothetical protein
MLGCDGDDATAERATDSEQDGDGSDQDAVPLTPELSPISESDAERLGAYVREMKCSGDGNPASPIAWSAINGACQDRAQALQLAIAMADPSLSGVPQTLVDSDLNLEALKAIAASPTFDVATINAAGPFATFQTLVDPGGSPIGDHELFWWWSYHHGVVLNVDGELRVLDLSIGDAPVPIAAWLTGFVESPDDCVHAVDDIWSEVWVYWNSCYQNFEPPAPPPVTCAYTITPIFTFRWDQTVADEESAVIASVTTMNTQTEVFRNTVSDSFGVDLTDEDIASILTDYRAGTLDDVCSLPNRMRFCDRR